MQTNPSQEILYDVYLGPGELMSLPADVAKQVGPGHWVVSIRPAEEETPVRNHSAFLNSYAPEDEGLYDDCHAG